jgi:hypothetical protein
MTRGDGLWWLGFICSLIALAAAVAAAIFLAWLSYGDDLKRWWRNR